MSKKTTSRTVKSNNQRSDAKNPNYRTPGTNPINAKVHGNRGKQLNLNKK